MVRSSVIGRSSDSIPRAEQAGLVFAFRARCVAILIVAFAVLALVPWPRNLYGACQPHAAGAKGQRAYYNAEKAGASSLRIGRACKRPESSTTYLHLKQAA